MKKPGLFLFLLLISFLSWAQEETQLKTQVRHTIDELRDFISIPNDALEHADINRNITWLTDKFTERGFNTSALPTKGESLFFAALPMEDDKPTVLIYMHFDGQSVDPSKWEQPNPYEVVLKAPADGGWQTMPFSDLSEDIHEDWRLFGRSVSDDKGPIVMFLNAIDLLRKNNQEIPMNIKVILDGEEERSSVHLPDAVKTYRELLEADFLVIADGPVHASGKPTVLFGCRGITTLTLTTYGPEKPQHSGHYGNYAPNPGFRLAQVLASMKDADGRVLIDGYYDGIEIAPEVQQIIQSVPEETAEINEHLGIKTAEKVGSFYQEALQYPSLNIRGMGSGWIGDKARTIVPGSATVELDLRLVPETDGARLKNLVKEHIQSLGYHILSGEPTAQDRSSYDKLITVEEGSVTDAFRTPLDHPYGRFLVDVLGTTFGEDVVQIRISGGTVPIAPFINELKVPAFLVPMVNPDNNQHSPNENLKIGQITYGLQAFYGILSSEIPKP